MPNLTLKPSSPEHICVPETEKQNFALRAIATDSHQCLLVDTSQACRGCRGLSERQIPCILASTSLVLRCFSS